MADTDVYSVTDAIVYCMQQPGTIAVAFVELATGRAIAGDGVEHLDIDAVTPIWTDLLHTFSEQIAPIGIINNNKTTNDIPEVILTMKDRVHLLYPLSQNGTGLYMYFVLDRVKGKVPLSLRCAMNIEANLDL